MCSPELEDVCIDGDSIRSNPRFWRWELNSAGRVECTVAIFCDEVQGYVGDLSLVIYNGFEDVSGIELANFCYVKSECFWGFTVVSRW